MAKLDKLSRLEGFKVFITKMTESSGNEQYFLRARRLDAAPGVWPDGMLEYSCAQTKHYSKKECIDRVLFESQYLLRFFGYTSEDLGFGNFDEEDMKFVEENKRFWRA